MREIVVYCFFVAACQSGEEKRPIGPKSPSPLETTTPPSSHAEASGAPIATKPPPAWPPTPHPTATPIQTDWCISGVAALDATTCYVLPDAPTRTLLVYLHGIVPPTATSVQKTNLETVLQNSARRAGVVAIVPRGVKGFAPQGQSDWYGWPTTVPSYDRHVKELVSDILTKQKAMESWLGVRFEQRFVMGSSSGAYFAALLALKGGMEADGFGFLSGGAGSKSSELATLPKTPIYVGFGKHDTVGPAARRLGAVFEQAGFPVRIAEHPVGHGAKEIYVDEAIAFFRERR